MALRNVLFFLGCIAYSSFFSGCTTLIVPPASGQGCSLHTDCPRNQACLKGLCVKADRSQYPVIRSECGGIFPDDRDDGGETFAIMDKGGPYYDTGQAGRFPDSQKGEYSLAENRLIDIGKNGRPPDEKAGSVPSPEKPPKTRLPDSDKDTNTAPKPVCKKGESQVCYPPNTRGCSLKSKSCIGQCALGKQICESGKWGKCNGAVLPTKKNPCENESGNGDCKNGKSDANGRCP